MPTIKELVKQYGQTMYLAGVREKEPDCDEILKEADKLLKDIIWLVSDDEA